MLDQTLPVEHGKWKYWVRVRDGEVINVQGYNNQYFHAHSDSRGVSVTNSSQAANRVFVDTAAGQVYFDADNTVFASIAGNLARLVYVGPNGGNGFLRYAFNNSNGSGVAFGHWEIFLPRIRRYVVLFIVWLVVFVAFFGAWVLPPHPKDNLGPIMKEMAPTALPILFPIGALSLYICIRNFRARKAISRKIEDAIQRVG